MGCSIEIFGQLDLLPTADPTQKKISVPRTNALWVELCCIQTYWTGKARLLSFSDYLKYVEKFRQVNFP